MNILAISSLYPHAGAPNYGIFVHNRYNAMANIPSTDVTMVVPYPSSWIRDLFPRYKNGFKNGFNSQKVRTISFPYFSVPKIMKQLEYFSAMKWARENADSLWMLYGPFDVIDVQWGYPDLMIALHFASKWQIPLNFTLRGEETFYLGDVRGSLIENHLTHVDGITALSAQLEKIAQSMKEEPFLVSDIIPNGTDTQKFSYGDQEAARDSLGIPKNKLIMLGVGSLILRKGFDRVIVALESLRREVEDNIHYYIVGGPGPEGDDSEILKELIEINNLGDYVTLVGSVNNAELPTWYRASDWFVLSSSGEGSPNVLSEAMSCGCYAVSTDVGCALELLSRGGMQKNVISENFEASLISAIKKNPRASSIERMALAETMSKFSWSACAEKTRDHLQALIHQYNSLVNSGS